MRERDETANFRGVAFLILTITVDPVERKVFRPRGNANGNETFNRGRF